MSSRVTLQRYILSKEFTKYFNDWIVVVVLVVEVALIGERTKPFEREFVLNDPSIQHPYAEHERVSAVNCLLISVLVPLFTIAVTLVAMHGRNFASSKEKFTYHLHLINLSVLGLFLSIALNGMVTDLLKNWISRPRPDFIARCGPKVPPKSGKGSFDLTKNYNLSICSAPMGEAVLFEGLRSCPSGHSSTSYSGLLYLSLWLAGQLRVFKPGVPVWKLLVATVPTFIATYIAVSRTQDYRHHFGDILLGGCIGSFIAVVMYFKYFNSVFNFDKCHLPHDTGNAVNEVALDLERRENGASYLPV